MQYQTERIENIAQSQQLIAELFGYIGEYFPDKEAQLRSDWQHFFQIWAGQLPYTKIKVFTARDEQNNIQGCVMVLVLDNPLFVVKPFIQRFVDITNDDKAFDEYVNVVLNSL